MTEPTETTARPADAAVPKPTEFTDAEQQLLDAMNVPTNRLGRGLLFREMQRTGLDPFAKHLYLREDWNNKAERNVYAVASTIDGFRIVAARQSTYEGQTAPQWCDKNGNWTDAWWAADAPVAARIGVYVRGYREPMWGIARFSEYKPSGSAGFMWGKMAAHMIAKVAEALAIRKAYPDQLSGVYTDDEMQQADARKDEQTDGGQRRKSRADDEWNTATGEPLAPPAPGMPTVTGEQLGEIARLLQVKRGATNGNRNFIIGQLVRRTVENVQTLSQSEARGIIETLTAESDLTAAATADAVPDPTPVGTPNNPAITTPQHRALHALLNKAGYGNRAKGLGLLARYVGRPIESSDNLSKAEASTIINKLSNGELPPPAAPGPEGEGIGLMDVLYQLIDDAHTDEEFDQARADIEREHAEGGIGGDQLAALQAHWADVRNEKQAMAGAVT